MLAATSILGVLDIAKAHKKPDLGNLTRILCKNSIVFIYLFFLHDLADHTPSFDNHHQQRWQLQPFTLKWISIHSEILTKTLITKQLRRTMHNRQEMAWIRRKDESTVSHLLTKRKERRVLVYIKVSQLSQQLWSQGHWHFLCIRTAWDAFQLQHWDFNKRAILCLYFTV